MNALNQVGQTHDVVFLWGHNHTGENTTDKNVYYVARGGSLTPQGGSTGTINFTYMNAGYIKNGYATQAVINDQNVVFTRYSTSGSVQSTNTMTRLFAGHTHSYTLTGSVSATCGTAGYRTYACACGDSYTETIAASGHTEVTDAAVAATCTTAGKTEGKHCSVCNTVLVAQQTVAAKGHTNAAAVKENEKAATCAVNGSYDSVVYCATCGVEISRNTVTVPATGAHVYATESSRKEATCTEDGYVIMACGCGATQQTTLKASGHTEITVEGKAATCTETGLTEGRKCDVCGEVTVAQTETEALGHNYVDGKCTRCGAADPEYVAGVTVSGKYISSGAASDVLTIQLIAEGQTELAYVFTNEANPANTGSWSIEGVAEGKYTLQVMKKNHVTREYEITVTDGIAAMEVEIWLLGDVDGNGKVNYTDYINVLAQAKNPAEVILTGYARQCADITGEGNISYTDYVAILSHAKAITFLW